MLLFSVMVNPLAPAACVIVTVQDAIPGVSMVVFAQLSPLRAGVPDASTVIDPETPVAGIAVPLGSEATTPVSWTVIVPAEAAPEIWNVAVATTPFAIAALLKP